MPNQPGITLPGATWNRIIDDVVNSMVDEIIDRSNELFPDGIFPTTQELPARQQLTAYLTQTVDLTDFARIGDPNYETDLRAGLRTDPPGSPFWKNALMIPGEFTRMAKEYVKLMERFTE